MSQKLNQTYTGCAVGCFNCIVLFVVINIALGLYFSHADKAARAMLG